MKKLLITLLIFSLMIVQTTFAIPTKELAEKYDDSYVAIDKNVVVINKTQHFAEYDQLDSNICVVSYIDLQTGTAHACGHTLTMRVSKKDDASLKLTQELLPMRDSSQGEFSEVYFDELSKRTLKGTKYVLNADIYGQQYLESFKGNSIYNKSKNGITFAYENLSDNAEIIQKGDIELGTAEMYTVYYDYNKKETIWEHIPIEIMDTDYSIYLHDIYENYEDVALAKIIPSDNKYASYSAKGQSGSPIIQNGKLVGVFMGKRDNDSSVIFINKTLN